MKDTIPPKWTRYPSYGPYQFEYIHDSYDGAPDSDTDHLMVQADSDYEAVLLIEELEAGL